jgi:hypothetical protein
MELVTAGFSALGSEYQGEQQQAVENSNAKVELQNATQAQLAAKANAQQVERNTRSTIANARASFAASGVDVSGSPLEVMHDIATKGELSRQLTIYQGQQQSKGFAGQAAIDKAKGEMDADAGYFQAGTTLLTAADKAAQTAFPATMAAMGG